MASSSRARRDSSREDVSDKRTIAHDWSRADSQVNLGSTISSLSSGGNLGDKLNSMGGGGAQGEANEDYLDKGMWTAA